MRRVISAIILLSLLGAAAPSRAAGTSKHGGSETANLPLTKLTASDGIAADRFGISVAVSGDTAVVGAPWEEEQRGAAYVYTREGGSWIEQAKLTASDGLATFKFGFSVAVSGDTAVVGTGPYHADVTKGSAYVFTRVGDTWTEEAKLTSSDGTLGDWFGYSVAVSGDTALIGAHGQDVRSNEAQGAAYVFTRTRGAWVERARLTSSDGAAEDNFGIGVALSGDTAVVGAYYDDVAGNANQGSAYVFTGKDGKWRQQGHLVASDGAADDSFGFWVDVSGETVVAGALYDDVGGSADQGSAYVFRRKDGNWTQQAHLVASDGAGGDAFGRSLAVSGDTMVVGAQFDDIDADLDQGSAYVFKRAAGVWAERTKLIASDGVSSTLFGVSVEMSGSTAVIGAGFHDDGAASPDEGAAYVWEDSVPPTITRVTDGPDPFTPSRGTRRSTRIAFTLSGRAAVTLELLNGAGRVVRTLLHGDTLSGDRHSVRWNGRNTKGRAVRAGKYEYRIRAVDAAGSKSPVVKGTVSVRR